MAFLYCWNLKMILIEKSENENWNFALLLIQLFTVSSLFPLEVLQNCKCCQLLRFITGNLESIRLIHQSINSLSVLVNHESPTSRRSYRFGSSHSSFSRTRWQFYWHWKLWLSEQKSLNEIELGPVGFDLAIVNLPLTATVLFWHVLGVPGDAAISFVDLARTNETWLKRWLNRDIWLRCWHCEHLDSPG